MNPMTEHVKKNIAKRLERKLKKFGKENPTKTPYWMAQRGVEILIKGGYVNNRNIYSY